MDAAEPGALPQELVFVDLETTGGNAGHDRITEVGIVRLCGDRTEEWSSLVNPERRIPAYIESFTGISNEMVADAPRFADIAAEVRQKLSGAVFVAHNARFDYSFLRSEFRRIDSSFSARVLCTVKLSRRLYPEQHRHSLDAVMQRHGLSCTSRHRALGDARVLHEFWARLRGDWPAQVLAREVQALLALKALPPQLPPELADELPEGAGVYRFFGEGDVLLYVGKSVSLRTRVLAHLQEAKFSSQVRQVVWQETAGELGASLLESDWIRRQNPVHNRRPKAGEADRTWRLRPAAVPALQLVAIDTLAQGDLAACFGLFRGERDARKAIVDIARAQQLCLKAIGLEPGAGSCLAYNLGRCRGACVGKEAPALHAVRLQLALSALKFQAWPYPARIALRESAFSGAQWHVLDNWRYLGTARDDEELEELRQQPAPASFDADSYRILVRHFATRRRLDWRDLAAGP